MKTANAIKAMPILLLALSTTLAGSEKKPAKAPAIDQKAMDEAFAKAGTPGPNHKLLEPIVGNWTFLSKMWMGPGEPTQSSGSANTTPIMGGRYFESDYKGDFNGMPFLGRGLMGYDNLAKHYVATWIDNFGTMIMYFTGTYDPMSKTLTLHSTMDDAMKPGTKVKVRETIKILGADTHVMEWYETRAGKEAKTMEITYTRVK